MAAPATIEYSMDFYKSKVKWLILLIVVILVSVLVLKFVRALKRPANAKYVSGGGDLPPGWDPVPLTTEIYKVIDGVLVSSSTVNDTYRRFNELNDNQMIDVYNTWLDKKFDQEKKYYIWPYGTLTHAVDEGPGYFSIGSGPNQKDVMLANLKRLNLN